MKINVSIYSKKAKSADDTRRLVRVFNPCHAVFDHQQVVCLGEDEYVGGGDVGSVLKVKLYVVDTGHVERGGRLPYTALCGEGEYVHVTAGGVRPLKNGLYLSEEQTRHVVGPSRVSVKRQRSALDGVNNVTPHLGGVGGVEREVEAVHVSNGVASAAGSPFSGAYKPRKAVGGVVEVKLDLLRAGSGAGDGVALSLSGGDEVLVLDGGECLALFNVKVHVRDKELGVHVRGHKGGSGGGVEGRGGGVEAVEGHRGDIGGLVLVHNGATLGQSTESHLDLDLVVRKSDQGHRKTLLHEVLVEPERQRHVKSAGLAGELDHVGFDIVRVRELTDLFTKAGTRALGHFLPEEHPLRVTSVYLGTTDLDLDFRDDGETDGVHPVSGGVSEGNSHTRSVNYTSKRGSDSRELNLEHDVVHKVTVTANSGRNLLSESYGSGAEVVLFEVLSERRVTLVHRLEQSHVRVTVKVNILSSDSSNLDSI